MSTRCQVKVTQSGVGWEESVTLYHHCDGYPSGMVPIFQKAWADWGTDWRAERAGYCASFLCATDPTGFAPEDSHNLHGDIEYYYVLTVGKEGWRLACYSVPDWVSSPPSMDTMRLLVEGPVADVEGLPHSARLKQPA